MAQTAHTPGPWEAIGLGVWREGSVIAQCHWISGQVGTWDAEANARLISAAPEMLEALNNVRKLIAEAAMTGFNHKDGEWAERLFLSQQVTSAAIKKATGA